MPVISALGRQRQEDHKFIAGLSCTTISTLTGKNAAKERDPT